MLRFAISPTQDINITQLRIALLNHIFSKQHTQELLVRIDDTNKVKNIEGKDKEILEVLNLFNIDYSRVILESENIKYHTGMGMKLLLDKKAFNCFCSDEALEEDRQKAKKEGISYSYNGFCETISDETKFHCNAPFVVRMKKPEQNIKVTDLLQGDIEFTPNEVDSVIILDHAKSPTHNFASAIDDMLYNIETVIKENSNLQDTPKEIHIRESLGYDKQIQYAHIPDIANTNTSLKSLIEEGYLPVAIANYLLLLGYNAPCEIFTVEEAIAWFDINKLSKEAVTFDKNRLDSINKEHLQTVDNMRLSKIIGYADEDIGKLAKVYLSECNTTKEIKEKIDTIFNTKKDNEEFKIVKECLMNAPFMNDFKELKKYITDKTGLKDDDLLLPLRVILTGTTKGPDLNDIYPLIKNYLGEII